MADFQAGNASLPATSGKNITPSDTARIEPLTRAVAFGVAGNIAVEYVDGTQHVIAGLAPGVMHPMQVGRILATGTTATSISVFW